MNVLKMGDFKYNTLKNIEIKALKHWVLSNANIANPIAGPTVPTCYTVIGTAAGGCTNSDTVCIFVLGNPPLPTITEGWDSVMCSP